MNCTETARTLRKLKNELIGNPLAKAALGQTEVNRIVQFLDPSGEPSSSQICVDVCIEAAHIISALSFGSAAALEHLIHANTHIKLLGAISTCPGDDSVALRNALARALKSFAAAVADTAGPAQWGLGYGISAMHSDATALMDDIFRLETLDTLLPMLLDKSTQIRTSIAQLLALSIRNDPHRVEVMSWAPPEERPKEVIARRGWEKPEVSQSNPHSRQGGWSARVMISELESRDLKVQEAALSALASLARDNRPLASAILKPSNVSDLPPFKTIVSLMRSRQSDVQLAACLCATCVLRACQSSPSEHPATLPLVHTLNRMIGSRAESLSFRTRACWILYQLCADDKALCRLAYADGCLDTLSELAVSTAPPDEVSDWNEEESENLSRLREAVLTVIATIALFENDIREYIMSTPRLMSIMKLSLTHRHVGVRWAACQCVRTLARAVAVVRTSVVDSGLGLGVLEVLLKQDEDRRVTIVATAAVSNLVNSFSPLQPVFVERGLIPRLVQLAHAPDEETKVNALWAFKNLINRSPNALKTLVIESITLDYLARLFADPNPAIQEQAIHIVQNFVTDFHSVETVFVQIGPEVFLDKVQASAHSTNEHVVRQTMNLLVNISNSSDSYRILLLSREKILDALRSHIVHPNVEIRRPVSACLSQLADVRPRTHCTRLRMAGIEGTLRQICGGVGVHGHGHGHSFVGSTSGSGGTQMGVEEDTEVKENAQHALRLLESSHFEDSA